MNWIQKTPRVGGVYWYVNPRREVMKPQICELGEDGTYGCVIWDEVGFRTDKVTCQDWWWYGPIDVPDMTFLKLKMKARKQKAERRTR